MLSITVDHAAVTRALGDLQRQIPFATAKALNDVANDAQRAIQGGLAQRFTLRRPDFILRTIKRERPADFASKTSLVATVRVDPRRDILAKFEEGGTKAPVSGRAIAIPTSQVRRTKAQLVQKSQRPRALLASGRAFSKDGKLLVRVGRGAKALLRAAYIFKPAVRIPRRLGFVETATATVDRQWESRASEAVARAVATMR